MDDARRRRGLPLFMFATDRKATFESSHYPLIENYHHPRYLALNRLACHRMAATANTPGPVRRLQNIRSELEVGLQCLKLKINFPNRVGRQIGAFSARKCHFKDPAFFHDIRSYPWNILFRTDH